MLGFQVLCPLCVPCWPSQGFVMLFLMTGNGSSFPPPFPVTPRLHPPPPHPGSQLSLITSGPSCSYPMGNPVSTSQGGHTWVSVSPASVSSPPLVGKLLRHRAGCWHSGGHSVYANSWEFLSSFPLASFSQALSFPACPRSLYPALSWACAGWREASCGP